MTIPTFAVGLPPSVLSCCAETPLRQLSMPLMSFAWRQMHANFLRRYKWAFGPGYNFSSIPVVAAPDFDNFTNVCEQMLQVCPPTGIVFCILTLVQDKTFSPSGSFRLAQTILSQLIASRSVGGYAGLWTEERIQVCIPPPTVNYAI